jgi:3'-5' exoribonuclease
LRFQPQRIGSAVLPNAMSEAGTTFFEEVGIEEGATLERRYANELAEGERVDADFAMRAKELRAAKNGEAYLAFEFADRSGSIPGVCFRPNADALSAPVGCIVRVRGTVTTYRGTKRISVEQIRPAASWNAEELLASSPREAEELFSEFTGLVRGVRAKDLQRVLRAVFSDRDFMARFRKCPGSQSYHHACLGGLLEHTVAVATICAQIAERYSECDRDLLVTAALLHDIGKCDELSFDTSIEYTDRGRLLGHVVLGIEHLRDALTRTRAAVDPDVLTRLEHAVLSHHGELEWGSPKRPCTLEGLLLHHADNLDAKAAGFSAVMSGARRADEVWTDASNLFRRPLYAPRAAEDDRFAPAREDLQYAERLSA